MGMKCVFNECEIPCFVRIINNDTQSKRCILKLSFKYLIGYELYCIMCDKIYSNGVIFQCLTYFKMLKSNFPSRKDFIQRR